MQHLISIDPSINTLGIAYFFCEGVTNSWRLIKYQLIEAPKSVHAMSDENRIIWMVDTVRTWVGNLSLPHIGTRKVIIERPQQWGSFKGEASTHSGDLHLLFLIVGALFGCFLKDYDMQLIRVATWKGSLPKDVTEKRMKKKYNIETFESQDVSDAVGLGDFYITEEATNGKS